MRLLNNKIILITGASSGIGEACAQVFAAHGAQLILSARREQRLQILQKELEAQYGTRCLLLPLDVRQKAQVQQLSRLPSSWQAIDILIYYLFQVCLLLRYCRLNNETHAIIHFSIR